MPQRTVIRLNTVPQLDRVADPERIRNPTRSDFEVQQFTNQAKENARANKPIC